MGAQTSSLNCCLENRDQKPRQTHSQRRGLYHAVGKNEELDVEIAKHKATGRASTNLVTDDSLAGVCCQQENNKSKVKLCSVPVQTGPALPTTPRRLRSNPMASTVISTQSLIIAAMVAKKTALEDKLDKTLIDG